MLCDGWWPIVDHPAEPLNHAARGTDDHARWPGEVLNGNRRLPYRLPVAIRGSERLGR